MLLQVCANLVIHPELIILVKEISTVGKLSNSPMPDAAAD